MMIHHRSRAIGLAIVVILFVTSLASAQINSASTQPEINFTVSMPKPYTHLLEVAMRVRGSRLPAQTNLVMPVWTPGSYLVREYERHVQDFAAADAQGRALRWGKVNKNTWRVEASGANEFTVTYRVYANELTVRTNEVNDRHAFWNNAALLMYPEGQLNAPSTLRIMPFGNWKIATGLPAVAGKQNTFSAENFDILYDSPIEVGAFKTISFEVRNVPHRIIIDGEGNYDANKLRDDVKKIVETEAMMMGDIPYKDYTFILHLRSTDGGGLEHLNSTALLVGRFGFRPESSYQDFLSLVAHEFFHLWNVKRIRPDALGPFDYTRENYTKLLWVAEGLTEYYSYLLLRRANLISEKDYLEMVAKSIQDLQKKPGRLVMSAEEASFDAWIKYYRRDENAVNSQISYFDKGALLGMLLDLEIRKRTSGAKSLDDVMRYLYTEYAKKGRNYTPEDFQRISELIAGSSLEQFFARYVRGRDELDYHAGLNAIGLQLETTGTGKTSEPQAFLGADVDQEGERLLIKKVYSGTPAYDHGLNANDQIVAMDNMRVTEETFNARLKERRPGDIINLNIFRFDDLRTFAVKLGKNTETDYRIAPLKQLSAEQARLYREWLGASAESRK
ncbi:MAG: M61 family metallopeptidase [Acidobacteria bacterium]|nr:M61 family metallopeptidase [Acidobacteriota bacterium]